MDTDVVVFGGGAAGLWVLDELVRRGLRVVLFEAGRLGTGQTACCQGIIHGGLKYTLHGVLTPSARHIREMPGLWRQCLSGRRQPDLSSTLVRSDFCYLWRTDTLRSRVGMLGAQYGLRVKPRELPPEQRPGVLQSCPGTVARVDEPVIDPRSFLTTLAARHRRRLFRLSPDAVEFQWSGDGRRVHSLRVRPPHGPEPVVVRCRWVVLAAGAGNGELRRRAGLDPEILQRRPLHMVLLRGPLPRLNGHCVDGARTRVTVTWAEDGDGKVVWQLGGQVAEDGVRMEPDELVRHARNELQAVLPRLDLSQVEWATYRVDRVERATPGRRRPAAHQILQDGNCLTVWPTKLALVPQLARDVAERVLAQLAEGSAERAASDGGRTPTSTHAPAENQTTPLRPNGPATPTDAAPDRPPWSDWPRPEVAQPPWQSVGQWVRLDGPSGQTRRRAA